MLGARRPVQMREARLIRHAIERLDDGFAHLRGADGAAVFLRDIGGAIAFIEHEGDRPFDLVGGRAQIEGIAKRHGEAGDGGDRVGDAACPAMSGAEPCTGS